MNLSSWGAMFFRQSALASAIILLLACTAERLAPGSVLSYISLWKLVTGVLLIQLVAASSTPVLSRASYEGERIILLLLGLGAVLFLFLIVREGGDRSLLLVGCACTTLLLSIFALQHKS